MEFTAEAIANGLSATESGKGWLAHCPAHDDKNPSLSIDEGQDGKPLFFCRSGCEQGAIISALRDCGLWPETPTGRVLNKNTAGFSYAGPTDRQPSKAELELPNIGELEAVYEYLDENGRCLGFQRRFRTADGKTFRPLTPWKYTDGIVQWEPKGFPKPLPIFGADHLANRPDALVLVVEGEKTAEAARPLFPDYVVVSWPSGGKSVDKANWQPLASRSVVIWPDADNAGKNAGKKLRDLLCPMARTVVLIDIPTDLPEGWDLADPAPDGFDPINLLEKHLQPDRALVPYIMTANELADFDIPERQYVVEPFLPLESLSMVFAARGLGKTWFALSLAIAVARGAKFLSFNVPEPRKVLYIDGEMSMADLKGRITSLADARTDNLNILPSEKLFRESTPLNINEHGTQELILRTLKTLEAEGNRPALIILDNLSSLGGGVDENDNTALESQLHWLLNLRHRGYAVLLVHHAGKSGDQRGASRREDLLDTSIKLEKPTVRKDEPPPNGAAFKVEFVKTRGLMPTPNVFNLELAPNEFGDLSWGMDDTEEPKPAIQTLHQILEGPIGHGGRHPYEAQTQLVEDMGITKGTVSKHIKELRSAELVDMQSRDGIFVTNKGLEALKRYYRDIDKHLSNATIFGGHQDDLPI